MRNPKRIDKFSRRFRFYWHLVGEDLRFWQVFLSLVDDYAELNKIEVPIDPFYIEDTKWLEAIEYGIAKRNHA